MLAAAAAPLAIGILCIYATTRVSIVATPLVLIFGFAIWIMLNWIKRIASLYHSPLRKIPCRDSDVSFLEAITIGTLHRYRTGWMGEGANSFLALRGKLELIYIPFGHLLVCTADPDIIRYVLQEDSTNWASKGDVRGRQMARALLGKSTMIFAEGETHRRHRLIASPAFRPAMLRQYMGSVGHCVQSLIAEWQSVILSNTQDRGNSCIEIRHGIGRFAFAIINEIGFGDRLNTNDESSELASCYHDILRIGTQDVRQVQKKQYFAFWQYLPSPSNIKILLQLRRLHKAVDAKIEDRRNRREALAKSSRPQSDYLDTLLLAHEGGQLSLSEARDEMLTLLLAGHETASTTLGWALLLLAQNPKAQSIAAEEARLIIGPLSSEAKVTLTTFERLIYTTAVVRETLRLYSTVSATQRVNEADAEIAGYEIPKNTTLALYFTAMHRNEDIWGPDAACFRPDRFLDESTVPWKAWMPFGEGPHKCLGYRFALAEMVLAVAMLLLEFIFEPDLEETDIKPYYVQIILIPYPPIKLRINPRP